MNAENSQFHSEWKITDSGVDDFLTILQNDNDVKGETTM